MMFLDCPAYLDDEHTARCGLPAEVRCRFTMRSSDGPLEAAMTRCPAGHWFNGAIDSLTRSENKHEAGTVAHASAASHGSLPRPPEGRDSTAGVTRLEFPADPGQAVRRPNCAPPYYLGRPALLYITAVRRSRTASGYPVQAVTGGGQETPRGDGGVPAGTGAGPVGVAPAAAS